MRRQRLRLRKEAIEKFLHEYSLSEEEKDILLNRPIFENDSDVFFQVLDRACAIKQRCTELMQDPYCMMTATVELLETISSEEETAYHRLFGWCQNECRLSGDRKYCLDGSNASYLHLHQAFLVLRQKESFFNHCITEFVNNRRNILAILLSENLGQWSHQSHDHPNQLLSDLFTWLHEYINEERNGIRFLLTKEGEEENDRVIANCLDVVFSGANSYIQEYVVPLFEENSNLPQLFESKHAQFADFLIELDLFHAAVRRADIVDAHHIIAGNARQALFQALPLRLQLLPIGCEREEEGGHE